MIHDDTPPSDRSLSDDTADVPGPETQPMQVDRHPQLGSFSIEEKIGEGGMGVVYRAYDPDLQRTVAIKRIHPKLTGQRDLAERFVSEARAIAAVTHANIAQIHAIHAREADTPPFFVMEFVEGESAESRVKRLGALSVSEAVDIAAQAARGLRAAQQRGIVHGDVKPSNLVITARGLVKLVDFGLSRPISDVGGSAGGSALGTPHYVSPEQSRRHAIDHRSDIYSLGCTLFFLLTGRPPFDRETQEEVIRAHCEEEAPDLGSIRSETPPELSRLVRRMLEKSPGSRFGNYDELLTALERVNERHVVDETTELTAEASPAQWIRSVTWILLWSCTLTLAAIVATSKSQTVRRWVGISADAETLAHALLRGVVSSHSGQDELTYDFSSASVIHPSITFEPQRNVKPPYILEQRGMHWIDFTQPIDFPFLSEIDEIELQGVRFTGTPDFEIKLGVDDVRPGNYLKFSVRVSNTSDPQSDRSNSSHWVSPISIATGGDRKEINLGTPATTRFEVRSLEDYVIRLTRESTPLEERSTGTAKFLLAIKRSDATGTVFDAPFSVPTEAVGAGHVRFRTEAKVNSKTWAVTIQRVLIRGRVDYEQISRDMRTKGGRR